MAKRYPKVECPFKRPSHLAQYDTPHIDVIIHALDYLKENSNYVPEAVFTLQPTSPQRTAADIDSAIEVFRRVHPEALASYQETDCNPYLLHVLDKEQNMMKPFVAKTKRYMQRQCCPQVYKENGALLIQRTKSLYNAYNNTDAMPGESGLLAKQVQPYITKVFADIDTEADWTAAEKELLKTYSSPEIEIKGNSSLFLFLILRSSTPTDNGTLRKKKQYSNSRLWAQNLNVLLLCNPVTTQWCITTLSTPWLNLD